MSSERRALPLWACGLLAFACGGPARAPEVSPESGAVPATSAAPASEPAQPGESVTPDGALFLSAIPVHASARAKALAAGSATDDDFASALRVRIQVLGTSKSFGELSKRTKRSLVNGMFQLEGLSDIASRDLPSKSERKSSFIIDYDEAAFGAAVDAFERESRPATPDALSDFASRFIEEKTYARGFDVASRVATTRSGDCTEHAVFTAALLRRFGFRARVIFGIVLLGVSGKATDPDLLAFGHAWVEHHDGKRWNIVDAALEPPPGPEGERTGAPGLSADVKVRLAYLPVNVLKDETAAFRRSLMDQLGVDSVRRIEIDVRSGPRQSGRTME